MRALSKLAINSVCGSDLHIYDLHPNDEVMSHPCHEFMGR